MIFILLYLFICVMALVFVCMMVYKYYDLFIEYADMNLGIKQRFIAFAALFVPIIHIITIFVAGKILLMDKDEFVEDFHKTMDKR